MITGAGGYIGRALTSGLHGDHNVIPVSLREQAVGNLQFDGVDAVLHLAGVAHRAGRVADEEYFDVNTKLTVKTATVARDRGVKHFVFFSSMAVFGSHGNLNDHSVVLDEQSACTPQTAYGASKLAAEAQLALLAADGFRVARVRPPMVYGAGCPGNMARLLQLVKLLPVLPFDYSENRRSVVYIENLVDFVRCVVGREEDGVLLPQDPAPVSIRDLVTALAEGVGKSVRLVRFPRRLFGLLCSARRRTMESLYGTLALDSRVTNERLGFAPRCTTRDGLQAMATGAGWPLRK
jgi:UDP-glucose 4-epimerase